MKKNIFKLKKDVHQKYLEAYSKYFNLRSLHKCDKEKLINMADEIEFITNYAFGIINKKYYKAIFLI